MDFPSDPFHQVRIGLQDYKEMIEMVTTNRAGDRNKYSDFITSRDYNRTKILDALSEISGSNMSIQHEKASMLQEIATLDQLVPEVDDYGRMLELSNKNFGQFQRPPNRLFLILPTNLDRWDEADISTHSFRLYFMCDNTDNFYWTPTSQPHHVHVAGHPGYDVNRPQEFLQQHGGHALTVLLMVKYKFCGLKYHVPGIDASKILATAPGAISRHGLTLDSIGSLIDKMIAYIQALLQTSQSDSLDNCSWDIKPFLQLDDNDNGTGDLFLFQHYHPCDDEAGDTYWCEHSHIGDNQWICEDHFPTDTMTKALEQFIQSLGGLMDRHNRIIRVALRSESEVRNLATYHKGKARFFELFVHITWKASKEEVRHVCEQLVWAGFNLLHVHGVSSLVASQSPIEFRNMTSLIILHDYQQPNWTYISMSLKKQGHGQIGLLFQQPIDTSHIFWTDLASYLSDELKKFQEGSGDRALGTLRWILDEHKISGLAGINVFSHNGNCWEGQLTVKGGRYYGVEQVSIPSTRFSASDLECGLLRRLVLNCYHAKDMLQALSLIKSNPLLLSIDLPAERCNVSASIESIRQKCYGRVLPLEVTSLDYHGTVLAKVVIRSKDDSVSLEASTHSQSTPTIDVLEWRLDQVSTRLRDYDVQLLESASQVIPSLLINLTLDITALTAQGLANLCIVLQRSTLEHLHIKCVPFIPYYGASVGSVLRAIQWPTIKSLVLTGNNIDDWLQVWGSNGDLFDLAGSWFATSAFGPCLSSLHVIASDMNENELSHASALAIQHLVYSSRLVELHLKNVVLQESRDWDLVLGGIHYAKLKKIALQNCNIPESQRRKAVVGRPFLSIKDRVGGWMRNTF